MVEVTPLTPTILIVEPRTGYLTRDGFRFLQAVQQKIGPESAFVTIDGEQTLTNKTIDGDLNTLSDIATASLKSRTGTDPSVATGTKGAASSVVMWNGDGDLVDGGILVALLVTTTGIQTLTNKTLTSPTINGGVISGITDLAIIDGGTGASTAADAFSNLKQAATDAATGVVELATTAETVTGTDTTRAVTPAGVKAVGDTKQPLDADLTAIAALTTTAYGRSVLTQADAAALRTLAGLGTASVKNYAEGTWSPTIAFGGAAVGVTYDAANTEGSYTRIGRLVVLTGVIALTAKGSSTGSVTIEGLPFANPDQYYYTGSLGLYAGFSALTGALAVASYSGASNLRLNMTGATGTAPVTDANVTNGTYFYFTIAYEVA